MYIAPEPPTPVIENGTNDELACFAEAALGT